MRHLQGYEVKKAKLKIFEIGVFVIASCYEVMNHVDNYGLDMVQLHGDETPHYCAKLSDYISVIKAFRIIENDHKEWKIKDFYEGTDMFMFDMEGVGSIASGRKFNNARLKGITIHKPFLLSGDIEHGDEPAIKKLMKDPVSKNLFAININSKFELARGIMNMDKVRRFVDEMTATKK